MNSQDKSGESHKNHKCPTCGQAYHRPARLREHIGRVHEGIHYQCPNCLKFFRTKQSRDRHQYQCSGITYKCQHCDQTFSSVSYLANHVAQVHTAQKRSSSSQEGITASKQARLDDEWREDPIQPEPSMLPNEEDELSSPVQEIFQHHWSSIRTHHHTGQHVQDVYNFRIKDLNMHSLVDQLQQLFRNQHTRFKVNVSFGFILRHTETGELRYYHSSQNMGRLLDVPHMVSNQRDFDAFLDSILVEDVLEWARQQRPDSKWIVLSVTNLTVFVNKLPNHLIGNPSVVLPDYLKNRKGLIALDKDIKGNSSYNDNLCFFRALVVHRGVDRNPTTTFEAAVKKTFKDIIGGNPLSFKGVMLEDLPTLENKLQMNVNVFELKRQEGEPIVGRVVQRSFHKYKDTMNLNVYGDHFSLITNLDRYCQSFECPCCHKLWKQLFRLNRHMKGCTNVTKRKFIGGSYQNELTVFELLIDEGIMVPKEYQFYPYRITYDFECYFDRQDVPSCTDKLQWQAKHVPLSVSICSNVPGFEKPKCLITTGKPDSLVTDMVSYMHDIQETAALLVTEQHTLYYTELLQLIDKKERLESKMRMMMVLTKKKRMYILSAESNTNITVG